ncbi:protein-tyrosine phosphatase-like protein [Phyllosticta capitalensis]|uniref:Protein-tyrosine phosphatase-like protein n=1 Tax=Phyllosticta capitalensis TaxID=121624 RepID=A0ABR1YDW5_9PEZI
MSTPSPLQVPASPASSKRSRSHESIPSSAAVSSLSIENSSPSSAKGASPANSNEAATDKAPIPPFLSHTRSGSTAANNGKPAQWMRVSGDIASQRNRYLNVDPFVNNCVKLQVPQGQDGYINASPIVLKSSKTGNTKNFIATQGPRDNTHSHMWRMIWHECASPAVVVMLTQTHESGREKCFRYYPNDLNSPKMVVNEHDEFGDGDVWEVTLISVTEDEHTRSKIRELEMKNRNSGESKTVWHLLFEGWPDFSVPEGADKEALLNLVPLSLTKNSSNPSNPRIVHCSAGVGRSGTFIALDHLLSELAEGSLDDVPQGQDPIEETVEALRTQRMMMVQGESQFALLYETLREKWIERWRSRMARNGVGAEKHAASEDEEREAKVARLATELEAEMRQNAAAAER